LHDTNGVCEEYLYDASNMPLLDPMLRTAPWQE